MGIRGGDVQSYTGARDRLVHRVTVTTVSQSLPALITAAGGTLSANVEEIEIVNNGGATVYYQCGGVAATATDAAIANGGNYTSVGNATNQAAASLIAAGNVFVHLIERIVR